MFILQPSNQATTSCTCSVDYSLLLIDDHLCRQQQTCTCSHQRVARASLRVKLNLLIMSEPPANGDADNYHPDLATHAERSSDSLIQPSRKLSKLSDAQKASQLLRRTVNQDEHKRLIEDFDILLLRHSQEQEELAEKYCLKPEYLEKLKGTSKHYKAKRVVNIENAKVHMKSVEVNAGD